MELSFHKGTRTGWRVEESDILFNAVREASHLGTPLCNVFVQVASSLGRRPNSVRNYYYTQLRQRPDANLNRAAPFQTFTKEEVRDLLRTVLIACSQGISVRACVIRMAGGDRGLMLRYQNKYRSILLKRPHLMAEVAQELRQDGYAVLDGPDSFYQKKSSARTTIQQNQAQQPSQAFDDPAVQQMLEGITILLKRALDFKGRNKPAGYDRLQLTYDLTRMHWEDEQKRIHKAVNEMLNICREFLGISIDLRKKNLEGFSGLLALNVSNLENLVGERAI